MNRYFKSGMILAVSAGCAVCFLSANLQADEKTGREFSELVKELNNDLSTAKQKVEQIEEQRLSQKKVTPGKLLPERAEALKKLETLSKEFDKAKDPEVKKEVSDQIEKQVKTVTKLSTDFLESMKNDLVSQDKQLEIIEESLSDVIMKMGKLQQIAAKDASGVSPELAKYRARKSLHNLAQMVELFAEKHRNAQQWNSVRRTIMLQDTILKRSTVATDKIQKLLDTQKKLYEQVLAQVTIARRGIESEKKILAQVGLGEIAKSMLRKAAGLLLGNQSITQLGETAFIKSEQRQQQVLDFLEQDQGNGAYGTGTVGESVETSSSAISDDYRNYLAQGVK